MEKEDCQGLEREVLAYNVSSRGNVKKFTFPLLFGPAISLFWDVSYDGVTSCSYDAFLSRNCMLCEKCVSASLVSVSETGCAMRICAKVTNPVRSERRCVGSGMPALYDPFTYAPCQPRQTQDLHIPDAPTSASSQRNRNVF